MFHILVGATAWELTEIKNRLKPFKTALNELVASFKTAINSLTKGYNQASKQQKDQVDNSKKTGANRVVPASGYDMFFERAMEKGTLAETLDVKTVAHGMESLPKPIVFQNLLDPEDPAFADIITAVNAIKHKFVDHALRGTVGRAERALKIHANGSSGPGISVSELLFRFQNRE